MASCFLQVSLRVLASFRCYVAKNTCEFHAEPIVSRRVYQNSMTDFTCNVHLKRRSGMRKGLMHNMVTRTQDPGPLPGVKSTEEMLPVVKWRQGFPHAFTHGAEKG
eukprot:2203730-Amphidinium_carterae.2